MNRFKTAIACGLLAVSVAASALAGCGDKKVDGTATAMTINGEKINVGTANFILRYQQAEMAKMMQSYGMTDTSFWDTEVPDDSSESSSTESVSSTSSSSESVSSSSVSSTSASSSSSESDSSDETETYGDQYKDSILDSIEEMVLLRQHADDYGFKMNDVYKNLLNNVVDETVEANEDALEKIGATKDDVSNAIELMSYSTYLRNLMTADVDTNVSDEEAAQTTITYSRRLLTNYDDSGNGTEMTDEEKADAKQKMQQLLDQVKASDDPATADISSMADAIDEDFTTATVGFGSDDTSLDDKVKEAAKSLKDGEVYPEVIDTGDYYYIVRLDKTFDEEKTEEKKQSIVTQRQNDEYDKILQGWKDEAKVETTDAWKDLKVTAADAYVVKTQSDTSTSTSSGSTTSTSAESTTSSTSGTDTPTTSSSVSGTSESTGTSSTSTK